MAESLILLSVMQFHCITALQLTKLLWQPSSLTWVQSMLRGLADAGYLERDRIPTRQSRGPAPYFYAITRKGMQHLRNLGGTIPARARPYRVSAWSYLHIAHMLAVNEVLIAAEQLTQTYPVVTLARVLHDVDLKRTPVRVPLPDGSTQTVVPDGFLDFEVRIEAGYRLPICLEIDRATEGQTKFRQKVRALLAFSRGPYQQAFRRQMLTIAVITTAGVERRDALLSWTETELDALHVSDDELDLFRFAAFPLDWDVPEAQRPTPTTLYLEPVWRTPFSHELVSLLEGIQ